MHMRCASLVDLTFRGECSGTRFGKCLLSLILEPHILQTPSDTYYVCSTKPASRIDYIAVNNFSRSGKTKISESSLCYQLECGPLRLGTL
jgi:hypothetical protein